MQIEPTPGAFNAFGPTAVTGAGHVSAGATAAAPALTADVTTAGTLPDQTTMDAIRKAIAMLTASDPTQSDGTSDPDGDGDTDPLSAILAANPSQTSTTATDPGALGLDMFA